MKPATNSVPTAEIFEFVELVAVFELLRKCYSGFAFRQKPFGLVMEYYSAKNIHRLLSKLFGISNLAIAFKSLKILWESRCIISDSALGTCRSQL